MTYCMYVLTLQSKTLFDEEDPFYEIPCAQPQHSPRGESSHSRKRDKSELSDSDSEGDQGLSKGDQSETSSESSSSEEEVDKSKQRYLCTQSCE